MSHVTSSRWNLNDLKCTCKQTNLGKQPRKTSRKNSRVSMSEKLKEKQREKEGGKIKGAARHWFWRLKSNPFEIYCSIYICLDCQ